MGRARCTELLFDAIELVSARLHTKSVMPMPIQMLMLMLMLMLLAVADNSDSI
jgi:hypothetical protein